MTRLLLRILMLAAIGFGCILISAVPLRPGAPLWPMPDLLLALCSYWVLRRPDTAPLIVIFALGLAADLILMRPIGIGALALVLVTEILRSQVRQMRDIPFVAEWLLITLMIGAAVTLQVVLMWISLGNLPPLRDMALYAGATALSYPVMAILCGGLLGLRHRNTGQMSYSTYLGEG